MNITFSYAAIFGIFYVLLSVRVILLRQKVGVTLGHGNDETLLRAIIAHGNFSEYIPFALLLIYFVELQTNNTLYIHVLCIALLFARISHALGISNVNELLRFRVFGMVTTATVILASAILILIYSLLKVA